MKKFLIAAIGLGLVVVSCGTKESSMPSGNSDSAAVDNATTAAPSTTDSTAATMATPDTVKMKVDSAAATPPAK